MKYIFWVVGSIIAAVIGFIGMILFIPSTVLYHISKWLVTLSTDFIEMICEDSE